MTPRFVIERLSGQDRSGFDCQSEPLNKYLRNQAGQEERRRISACFLAIEIATQRIAGYYTLAMSSVALTDLPEELARKLPRYPAVPTARLGRLGVDRAYQGVGLGAALLWDAIDRAAGSQVAAYAMLVDAKDEDAAAFYRRHGFIALPSVGLSLFLPLASLRPAPIFP